MNELRTPFRIRGSGILRYRSLFTVRWLASVWLASWMVSGRGADTNRLDAIFQEALFAEEGRQDLPTAIRGYESVVRAVEEQRRFAATAVFRLGECYRKLGRTNDAVARYRQVLENYPSERTLADLARQNLVALGAPAAAVASSVAGSSAGTNRTAAIAGPVDPDAPLDEERREMEQFERELRDSPDSAQRRMAERLRSAAQNGKFWMAKALLKAGADPNRSEGDRPPPLHMAAASGHKRVAQLLVESGADPNLLKGGQRPLQMAVGEKNISMIEFLIEKGANPALGDNEGVTILHKAASMKDNARVRQLLLQRGAPVNATNQLTGATPLHYAVDFGNADAIDDLVKAGADLKLRAASVPSDGREALPHWVNGSSEMFYYWTPLDIALFRRNPAIVRRLIAAGARYDFQFDTAPLPIQSVVDNRELLQDVIAASTPEALSRSAGALLTSAILAGDVSMVRSLLTKGVPANATAPGAEKLSMLHVLLSNRDAAECDVPFLEPFQNSPSGGMALI